MIYKEYRETKVQVHQTSAKSGPCLYLYLRNIIKNRKNSLALSTLTLDLCILTLHLLARLYAFEKTCLLR